MAEKEGGVSLNNNIDPCDEDELEMKLYIAAWVLFIIFFVVTIIMVILRKTILPI